MRPVRLMTRLPRLQRLVLGTMGLVPAALIGALAVPALAAAAGPVTTAASCSGTSPAITCNLWAEAGSVTVPGGSVATWGYATASGGSPTLPGPTIVVTAGDTITLNLVNHLPQPTSLVVQGLAGAPDLTSVASGASHAYTIKAAAPGTYLYEAGIVAGTQYQVAMGLHGALIVRPSGAAGQAYADPTTAFSDEVVIDLAEIDPLLNNSATPSSFDLRNFAPKYFLVNGVAYSSAGAPPIPVTAGGTTLLRYVNAGLFHHSMATLGLRQRQLGFDGSLLPAPRTLVADTLAPGQTADVLLAVPLTTAADTLYPVYDASLLLNNAATNGIGGMLALLDATGTPSGTDTVGPITSGASFDLGTGAIAASVSDATTGNGNVAAAEYFLDATGANGSGTALSGAFASPTEAVTATLDGPTLAGLASGTHSLYIHGQDAAGNWGAMVSVTFVVDRTGPIVSGIKLNPANAGGGVSVAVSATASDASTGNANITVAELSIDGGAATPVTLNKIAPDVSLTATIPALTISGLAEGSHTVGIRAQDALGNWGAAATQTLIVDRTAPTASGLAANPPANNGNIPQSSTQASVRLTVTLADPISGGVNSSLSGAEGFIDVAGANGAGFPFTAADGLYNTPNETAYADVPLTTIKLLASGNHTFLVHARDAAGNWGPTTSLVYLLDRTAPTMAGATFTAVSPTLGGGFTITLNTPVDPLVGGLASGITGGEYWISATAPAAGAGTQFTGTGPINVPAGTLTTGAHAVGVRIRDAAGNWSLVRTGSVTTTVVNIFSSTFDSGTRPWGWTSASTTTTSRLNTSTPGLTGNGRKLQAQANNTNYLQYNFGTAANPAAPTVDARFQFNPNGVTSTGQTIFASATNTAFGTVLGQVRYRRNGTQPQVQLQIASAANATWVNINAAVNSIEVVWQAVGSVGGAPGTFSLYLNGAATAAQTLTTTSTASVGAFRFGSVTVGTSTSNLYFDTFAAKRSVTTLYGQP
jgi:hypothetical protein